MVTREWALLIFTILGQMASGALLTLMLIRAFAIRKTNVQQANRLTDGPLFIVVPIMALALLASLFHLGNLINITKAVPNLGTSWLSREVIVAVVFVVLAALYTFLQWRKLSTELIRATIGWIAALVGQFQTIAMIMVYMIRTQPAWNTFATPITFLVTSFLLGVLVVAAALVATRAIGDETQTDLLRSTLRGIAITSIALVGVEFVVLPIYVLYLSTQGASALQTMSSMFGTYTAVLVLRLLLVFVGGGVLGAYLYENAANGKERNLALLVYSAFILVLIAEAMGRFLFYATHYSIGL
ncbi:MAG: dimethyl sulfoxide reductase anchor subunit [Chloroflexi bacterium]|nr:hypothetical protein [Chloroflexota bacterium]NOG76187.1 dimethyl sulfoxide reductase anchor subunit [Chloroflexota bacterium]WKZ52539.1 MAG: dimethyl sulfoxide reductase anchor subunit [Anaerolineales bacterium]HPP62581.1 dimethyl sulfoxide reductase anchor subunit [Anaerolineales bacterium]